MIDGELNSEAIEQPLVEVSSSDAEIASLDQPQAPPVAATAAAPAPPAPERRSVVGRLWNYLNSATLE